MGRAAFTLIELLTVTAILLVLAVIAIPAVIHNHGEALRKKCLDNFSEVGRALVLYANDADDSLPMARYDALEKVRRTNFLGPAEAGPPIWADVVERYAKSRFVFTCPSDTLEAPNFETHQGYPLSFAINDYFYIQPGVSRETLTGGGLGEIGNAATKILLTETAAPSNRFTARPDEWRAPDGSAIWERHNGGANWIYGDLHAAVFAMPEAWKSTPPAIWQDPKKAATQPYPQWFPWMK